MIVLALDLSKRSTGWAVWGPGMSKPAHGRWVLGSEYTSRGGTFAKLHQNLLDLQRIARFDLIGFEAPIAPMQLQGATNIDTLRVLSGLAAHVESYAFARGCKVTEINVASWRKDFIGSAIVNEANADARRKRKATGKGSATDKLKALCIERCRSFGWRPETNDDADALGILDYLLAREGVQTPWREAEVLVPVLGGAA